MAEIYGAVLASQHPDINVREAENIVLVLKRLIEDMAAKKITVETCGHTLQKFCVDSLRKAEARGVERAAKLCDTQITYYLSQERKLGASDCAQAIRADAAKASNERG